MTGRSAAPVAKRKGQAKTWRDFLPTEAVVRPLIAQDFILTSFCTSYSVQSTCTLQKDISSKLKSLSYRQAFNSLLRIEG